MQWVVKAETVQNSLRISPSVMVPLTSPCAPVTTKNFASAPCSLSNLILSLIGAAADKTCKALIRFALFLCVQFS